MSRILHNPKVRRRAKAVHPRQDEVVRFSDTDQATCVLSKRSSEAQMAPNKKEKIDNLTPTACFIYPAARTGTVLERVRACYWRRTEVECSRILRFTFRVFSSFCPVCGSKPPRGNMNYEHCISFVSSLAQYALFAKTNAELMSHALKRCATMCRHFRRIPPQGRWRKQKRVMFVNRYPPDVR